MEHYDAIKWAVFMALTSLAEQLGFDKPKERRPGLVGIVSDYVRFQAGGASGVEVFFGAWHAIPYVEIQLAEGPVPALVEQLGDAIFERGGICRCGDRCIGIAASSRLLACYRAMIEQLQLEAVAGNASGAPAVPEDALKRYSGLPR